MRAITAVLIAFDEKKVSRRWAERKEFSLVVLGIDLLCDGCVGCVGKTRRRSTSVQLQLRSDGRVIVMARQLQPMHPLPPCFCLGRLSRSHTTPGTERCIVDRAACHVECCRTRYLTGTALFLSRPCTISRPTTLRRDLPAAAGSIVPHYLTTDPSEIACLLRKISSSQPLQH